MKFYVYKVTNILNGKIYIGKTNNIERRWRKHVRAAELKKNNYHYFQRAISKYGSSKFNIEEIGSYETEELAFDAEKYYIKLYNSKNRKYGYNLTDGGDGSSGRKILSKETLAILSEKHTAWHKTPEGIEASSKNNSSRSSHNTEECLEIQKLYLTMKYSFSDLASQFDTDKVIISKIINGTYFNVRNNSIISKEDLEKISKERKSSVGVKHRKLSKDTKTKLLEDIKNNILTRRQIAEKYNCSVRAIEYYIYNR